MAVISLSLYKLGKFACALEAQPMDKCTNLHKALLSCDGSQKQSMGRESVEREGMKGSPGREHLQLPRSKRKEVKNVSWPGCQH